MKAMKKAVSVSRERVYAIVKKRQRIEPISYAPENLAKAFFGIQLTGKKGKSTEAPRTGER